VLGRWRCERGICQSEGAPDQSHKWIALLFQNVPEWQVVPEVTYSICGEGRVIDVVAGHAASCTSLVIELKTILVDTHEVIGSADRRRRLAIRMAAERGRARLGRGWDAAGTRLGRGWDAAGTRLGRGAGCHLG
jgi:hypothetical protein